MSYRKSVSDRYAQFVMGTINRTKSKLGLIRKVLLLNDVYAWTDCITPDTRSAPKTAATSFGSESSFVCESRTMRMPTTILPSASDLTYASSVASQPNHPPEDLEEMTRAASYSDSGDDGNKAKQSTMGEVDRDDDHNSSYPRLSMENDTTTSPPSTPRSSPRESSSASEMKSPSSAGYMTPIEVQMKTLCQNRRASLVKKVDLPLGSCSLKDRLKLFSSNADAKSANPSPRPYKSNVSSASTPWRAPRTPAGPMLITNQHIKDDTGSPSVVTEAQQDSEEMQPETFSTDASQTTAVECRRGMLEEKEGEDSIIVSPAPPPKAENEADMERTENKVVKEDGKLGEGSPLRNELSVASIDSATLSEIMTIETELPPPTPSSLDEQDDLDGKVNEPPCQLNVESILPSQVSPTTSPPSPPLIVPASPSSSYSSSLSSSAGFMTPIEDQVKSLTRSRRASLVKTIALPEGMISLKDRLKAFEKQ